ncbi:uncharacterized protein LOC126987593 [Eriocheir sinensis]|uniref:uncharacterized protein LOC126987593 n=1 Tax=Eriocheir sinensis TaxID=95602 RepID=UPI0021C8D675|nr:uncharacterized protein LOC126987593 [Eriocheir sinensis]XP_050700662.1 uncharacterized protein LOC126987593 [Eriocheir sinensis]XP_050700663.1 uncharacterized protein LOC126987593 [Eriocheir sinensis]
MILAGRVNSMETLHYDPRETAAGNRRVRRSTGAASSPNPAQHTGTFTKKLRLAGDLPQFLRAAPDSNTLSVGPHEADDPQVCFRMHSFHVLATPSSEGGNIVVIEAQDGRHVTQDSANPQSLVLTAGEAPQQTRTTDSRFFRMFRATGDRDLRLKHLHSGMYLSASSSGVSLLSTDGSPDSILFTEFECTLT